MTEAEKIRYNELIAKEYDGEQLDDREAIEFARLERVRWRVSTGRCDARRDL